MMKTTAQQMFERLDKLWTRHKKKKDLVYPLHVQVEGATAVITDVGDLVINHSFWKTLAAQDAKGNQGEIMGANTR